MHWGRVWQKLIFDDEGDGHHALEWGYEGQFHIFHWKLIVKHFLSFIIWYLLTIKLFQTQFYKILVVYQGLKQSNILVYRQNPWFLVQYPWLHAITQMKSRFLGIIKCNYGKYDIKSEGKLGQKIVLDQ